MNNYTVQDLRREFPNDDACLEWIKEHRCREGISISIGKVLGLTKPL